MNNQNVQRAKMLQDGGDYDTTPKFCYLYWPNYLTRIFDVALHLNCLSAATETKTKKIREIRGQILYKPSIQTTHVRIFRCRLDHKRIDIFV